MNVNDFLSAEEIQKYKAQGYSDADIQSAVMEVNKSMGGAMTAGAGVNPRSLASNSMFTYGKEDNLVKWQLELDSILERAEHMLKQDKVTFVNGVLIWKPCEEDDIRCLNDFGVALLMQRLSNYINRNTILSDYDEETILFKVLDFGNELSDLIYLKYEDMGMDTLEKRKMYPMLVREMVDMVHSAYLRALHGKERDSLREARHVTQAEAVNPYVPVPYPRQERSMLNPMRYIGGKYK